MDFILYLIKEENKKETKTGLITVSLIFVFFAVIVSPLMYINLNVTAVILYLSVISIMYSVIFISIMYYNYVDSGIFKLKRKKKEMKKQLHLEKKKLEEASSICINEFEKMKKILSSFEDKELNNLFDNYRNKLIIGVKQNHELLKHVNDLKTIVLNGNELISNNEEEYLNNKILINLFLDKLKVHLKNKDIEISEIIQKIEDMEKLKIKEINQKYVAEINKLFK